jgi:hypothetical protein
VSEPVQGGRHRKPEELEDAGNPRPRRSPWNRGRDRAFVVSIVVVAVAAMVTVWATSDQRATVSETTTVAAALPPAPDTVPGTLAEAWRAPSPATPVPVAQGTTVVTGGGGEVAGRDPLTGRLRWRYARDLQLCTVAAAWSKALAVFRKDTGCSEVTQLDPNTGDRTAQRNGDAELGTRLVGDGSYVTTTGTRLLNTWRDDLVRSMEYGQVPAIVNPEKQPRTGCTYGTVAAASGNIGVIERCPGDSADRFTVFKATADEADEPKVVSSVLLAGRSARLVAMSGDLAAIALPERKLLVIDGPDGEQRSAYPLDLPDADLAKEPPGGVVPTARTASAIYWFTGSKTMALSRDDLTPRWTLSGALGAGTQFGQQLVVPVRGGLAVLDEADGRTVRTVGVDRRGYAGPVQLNSLGPVLLEQRGETLVALR